MPLDLSKPVQTRSGRSARILGSLHGSLNFPIVAAVYSPDYGAERVQCFSLAGLAFAQEGPHDLVNAPVRKKRYINVYDNAHRTLEEANNARNPGCIGVLELTVEMDSYNCPGRLLEVSIFQHAKEKTCCKPTPHAI